MAAAQINVMLGIHGKKTTPLHLYNPLRLYIAQHYSEQEAKDAEDDLQSVQQMRAAIEKPPDALDARCDLLLLYFRALTAMESRFPISNETEHVNTLYFTWFDAFRPGKKAAQQNIHFEKAAIVFNLGAVHSQIALRAERNSVIGLKQACNAFQLAAGAFAFLRDHISMKASGGGSMTVDVLAKCAGMLERLMLAQAQECVFEKVLIDGKPSSLCAKVAKQVALYYEAAHVALTLPPLTQHFGRAWVAHVQLKGAQFHAEAGYRAALDRHEKENIMEEIARLRAAVALLSEAKKSARGVANALLDSVLKLEASINQNLDRAINENDRVYMMRVPAVGTLPPLAAASLVKPTPMEEHLDASKEKLFLGLVPDSCAKALSKYTEMLDEVVRAQIEILQQASEITRVKLKSMNLPDSLLALEGNASLPDHLKDDLEAVQIDGGPEGFEVELRQLKDLRCVNEELLVQTEDILEKEAREDAHVRTQFGTRWLRPQSSTLTKNLRDRTYRFATSLKQAAESDARIERNIRDNASLLAILNSPPVEAALATLSKPILPLNGSEELVIVSLHQKLDELQMLASQRAGLEDMLKEMKLKDNILTKIMTTSGGLYEDLFKKELTKYDPISEEVAQNVEAQESLLQQIKAANDVFAATFNMPDYLASREHAYEQISAAVSKYQHIRENINEGLKFYTTLQDAINNLKQQCGDYVMTRNIQSHEMIEELQQQVTGISTSNKSSGRYAPAGQSAQRTASAVPLHTQRREASLGVLPPPPLYGMPCPYPQHNQPNSPQTLAQTHHQEASSVYTSQQQVPAPRSQQPNLSYLPTPSANFPPPPYYAQQASVLAVPPHAANVPETHNHSQSPYPGMQASYYNAPPSAGQGGQQNPPYFTPGGY